VSRARQTRGRSAATRIGIALRENIGWLRARAEDPELPAPTKNVLLHLQLRGASFSQDLARVTGLTADETQAALWELFRAGLVGPDTYGARGGAGGAGAPARG